MTNREFSLAAFCGQDLVVSEKLSNFSDNIRIFWSLMGLHYATPKL